jgi:ribonuclease III
VRGGSNGGAAGEPDGSELLRAIDTGLSPALLERALTHRSYAYENGGLPTNERLEFLGDAVLGLIVTDTLFRKYPDLPEGQLAKLRAAVVQMRALADVARSLRLGSYVRLGRGEEGTGGRDKSSILADTLEALIGAVYFECGLPAANRLVHRLFDPVIDRSAGLGAGLDWKTSLQELTASGFLGVPEYHVEESGPDHQKFFRASVRVAGRTYGSGSGRSKKEAEQQAAEAAWKEISGGTASAADASAGDAGAADAGAADAGAADGGAGSATAGNAAAVNGVVASGAAGSGSPAASGPGPLANGAHPAAGDAGTAGQVPGNDTGTAAQAPGNDAAGPGADAAPVPPAFPASPVPPGDDPAGD